MLKLDAFTGHETDGSDEPVRITGIMESDPLPSGWRVEDLGHRWAAICDDLNVSIEVKTKREAHFIAEACETCVQATRRRAE